MAGQQACCCSGSAKDYARFAACHQASDSFDYYMSMSDFSTCNLSWFEVYKIQPTTPGDFLCGTWYATDTAGSTLLTSSDCSYITEEDDCCSCENDTSECCSYNACLAYRRDVPLAVPMTFTGYLGGSNSGTCYGFDIETLSTGTPSFIAGTTKVQFTVSGTLKVTPTCSSSSYQCDGYSTPQPVDLPFSMTVQIQCAGDKLQKLAAAGADCSNRVEVCPDTTSGPGCTSGCQDCSMFEFSPQLVNFTDFMDPPEFVSDCRTAQRVNFDISIPFQVNVIAGTASSDGGCCDGDGGTIWRDQFFPNVTESATLTLRGYFEAL
jgi:hypothetical protein